MRILVVNGNTTQAITDRAVSAARAAAPAGVEIVGVTARFGADVVRAAPENLIAGHAILEALAAHHEGFDAAILAISFDTALAEARALLPIPAYGITESALAEAAALSDGIGVVTFGASSLDLYRSVFARHPAVGSIAEIAVVDIATTDAYIGADRLDGAILDNARRMVRERGVGAVVVCGAAMAGIAERLQPSAPCPLFDGVPAAVRAAVAQACDQESRPPARHREAAAPRMTGVSADLVRLFQGPR